MDNKKPQEEPGRMVIPFEKDAFADFIKSLLGKQQTITKTISGTFEISIENLTDVYHLVNQRIEQQNESRLIQFSTKVVYSDNSTRLLGSLAELETFSEPRDVYPVSIHLQIEYLIKFQDKQLPERQEISISFITNDMAAKDILEFDYEPHIFFRSHGTIHITINHTAVTWAYDIEALVVKKVRSLLKKESRFLLWIQKRSSGLSFALAAIFFLSSVAVNVVALFDLKAKFSSNFQKMQASSLDDQVRFLIQFQIDGAWVTQGIFSFVSILISLVVAISLAAWFDSSLSFSRPSYILINEEAKKNKELRDTRVSKKICSFVFSILTSLILGVVTKLIVGIIIT